MRGAAVVKLDEDSVQLFSSLCRCVVAATDACSAKVATLTRSNDTLLKKLETQPDELLVGLLRKYTSVLGEDPSIQRTIDFLAARNNGVSAEDALVRDVIHPKLKDEFAHYCNTLLHRGAYDLAFAGNEALFPGYTRKHLASVTFRNAFSLPLTKAHLNHCDPGLRIIRMTGLAITGSRVEFRRPVGPDVSTRNSGPDILQNPNSDVAAHQLRAKMLESTQPVLALVKEKTERLHATHTQSTVCEEADADIDNMKHVVALQTATAELTTYCANMRSMKAYVNMTSLPPQVLAKAQKVALDWLQFLSFGASGPSKQEIQARVTSQRRQTEALLQQLYEQTPQLLKVQTDESPEHWRQMYIESMSAALAPKLVQLIIKHSAPKQFTAFAQLVADFKETLSSDCTAFLRSTNVDAGPGSELMSALDYAQSVTLAGAGLIGDSESEAAAAFFNKACETSVQIDAAMYVLSLLSLDAFTQAHKDNLVKLSQQQSQCTELSSGVCKASIALERVVESVVGQATHMLQSKYEQLYAASDRIQQEVNKLLVGIDTHFEKKQRGQLAVRLAEVRKQCTDISKLCDAFRTVQLVLDAPVVQDLRSLIDKVMEHKKNTCNEMAELHAAQAQLNQCVQEAQQLHKLDFRRTSYYQFMLAAINAVHAVLILAFLK